MKFKVSLFISFNSIFSILKIVKLIHFYKTLNVLCSSRSSYLVDIMEYSHQRREKPSVDNKWYEKTILLQIDGRYNGSQKLNTLLLPLRGANVQSALSVFKIMYRL